MVSGTHARMESLGNSDYVPVSLRFSICICPGEGIRSYASRRVQAKSSCRRACLGASTHVPPPALSLLENALPAGLLCGARTHVPPPAGPTGDQTRPLRYHIRFITVWEPFAGGLALRRKNPRATTGPTGHEMRPLRYQSKSHCTSVWGRPLHLLTRLRNTLDQDRDRGKLEIHSLFSWWLLRRNSTVQFRLTSLGTDFKVELCACVCGRLGSKCDLGEHNERTLFITNSCT